MHWLSNDTPGFPHPKYANPDGLLAVGGALTAEWLLLAYSWGVFPWFNEGDPILWWHPDPRFVLYPHKLKVSKSMRPYFNQAKFRVTFDQHFAEVIEACSDIRRARQSGTWITDDMQAAYTNLHQLGYAHSVEVWEGDELVGGLYGIALGQVFFGESMFARASNASKVGFITLVRMLEQRGFQLIDCQQETAHLSSLGAEPIPRDTFLTILAANQDHLSTAGTWRNWI